MPSILYANEFDICVSMSDLVSWMEDEYSPNADLEAALSAAGIELDITKLYDGYFEGTPKGTDLFITSFSTEPLRTPSRHLPLNSL